MSRFIESNQKGLTDFGMCKVITKRGTKINIGYFGKGVSKLRKGLTINYFDHKHNKSKRGSEQKPIRDMMELPNQYFKSSISKTVVINPVGGVYAKRYYISKYGKQRLKRLKNKNETFFN